MPESFAETQKIIGNSHGSEISLIFSNGKVSGDLILENQTINLNDIKIIERHDRMYVIDKQNNLKIFLKQITSEKYIIIVKINSEDIQTKLRFIATVDSVNKNIGQRDMFAAMETKLNESNLSFKELEYQKKNNLIKEAKQQYEQNLEDLIECDYDSSGKCLTRNEILANFEKYKVVTGMALVVPEIIEEEVQETESVVVNHIGIEAFLSIPHHQEWEKVLRYSVLVTDDSGHKFDSSYGTFIGNELSDVSISGTIKNPDGVPIQSFDGVTDNFGEYWGEFLIPEGITTRGEYVISVDAVQTFSDNATSTSSNSGIFFVFPDDNGG